MATIATAEPPGPLWQQFRLWTEGRVLRDDKGRTGYVVCPRTRRQEYEEQTTSLANTYLVKWDGERLAQPLSREEIGKFMTNEFLDAPWVCWEVLAAQKAGWKIPDRNTLQWAMRRCRWTPKELLEGGVDSTPLMKVLQQERLEAAGTRGQQGILPVEQQGILPVEQQARVAKALKQAGKPKASAAHGRGTQGGDRGRAEARGAQALGNQGKGGSGKELLQVMSKLMKVLGRGRASQRGGAGTLGRVAEGSRAGVGGDELEVAGTEDRGEAAGTSGAGGSGKPQGPAGTSGVTAKQSNDGVPKSQKGTAGGGGGGSDPSTVVGRVARDVASSEADRLARAVAVKTAERLSVLLSAELAKREEGSGPGAGAAEVAGLAERVRALVEAKLGQRVLTKLSGCFAEDLGLHVRPSDAGGGSQGCASGGGGALGAAGHVGAAKQVGGAGGADGVGEQDGATADGKALEKAAAAAVRRLRVLGAAKELAVRVAVRVTAKVEGSTKARAGAKTAGKGTAAAKAGAGAANAKAGAAKAAATAKASSAGAAKGPGAGAAVAKGNAAAADKPPVKGGTRTTLIADTTGGAAGSPGSMRSPPRRPNDAPRAPDQRLASEAAQPQGGAAAAGVEGVEGVDYVRSWTGRCYPMDRCYQPGDVRVGDISPEDADGEFEVDWIVDEVKTRGVSHYLVKWKGYELNPGDGKAQKGDWEPRKNVQSTEAFKQWQSAKPDYYLAVPVPGPAAKGKSTPKSKRPRDVDI